MAKKAKDTKSSSMSRPALPAPGFYGAHVGSPQNVEFGKFSDLNYLKPSQQRAEEIGGGRVWPQTPFESSKMRERQGFQGSATFKFKKQNPSQ